MRNSKLCTWLAPLALALAMPVLAKADSCKAVPDHGPAPASLARGTAFSGPVVYIVDGDGLCVAIGPRAGLDWVEVRLSDFYAPELHAPGGAAAKTALEQIAMGQRAACVAGRQSYDRIVARCTIGGVSIGDQMRRAGIAEGGNGR